MYKTLVIALVTFSILINSQQQSPQSSLTAQPEILMTQTQEPTNEQKNPTDIAADVAIGSVVGSTIVAGANVISAGLISAAGFTSGGVAAGSLAAGVQAGIGLVQAGSIFAGLQSVGAIGAGILGVYAVPVIIGAGLAAGCYVLVSELTQK